LRRHTTGIAEIMIGAARIAALSTVACLSLGVGAAQAGLTSTTGRAAIAKPQVVRPAPPFSLPRLGAAGRLSLRSLNGKAVVLIFWGSYDSTFRQEAAQLERVWEHWRTRGVVVVGIDAQDFPSDALGAMRRYGITYPNVSDVNGTSLVNYAIDSTPETLFVDRAGALVGQRLVGQVTARDLSSNIKLALVSKAATTGTVVLVVAGAPSEYRFTLSKQSVPRGRVTFSITNKRRPGTRVRGLCPPGGRTNERHLRGRHGLHPRSYRRIGRRSGLVPVTGHLRVPLSRRRAREPRNEGTPEGDLVSPSPSRARAQGAGLTTRI
jgi:peroxiredoxin